MRFLGSTPLVEWKRGLVEPFIDEGVVPKSEPVEEGIISPPEYVYLIPDAPPGATRL
jgi:hypothetical protein